MKLNGKSRIEMGARLGWGSHKYSRTTLPTIVRLALILLVSCAFLTGGVNPAWAGVWTNYGPPFCPYGDECVYKHESDDGIDEAAAGANGTSGLVGAVAMAYAGAPRAQAMVLFDFYVGTTKDVDIAATVDYVDGTSSFGFYAATGTEIVYRIDQGQKRTITLNALWDDAEVISSIGSIVSTISGLGTGTIIDAIQITDMLWETSVAANTFYDLVLDNKATRRRFSLGSHRLAPGWHTVGVGVGARADGAFSFARAAIYGWVEAIHLTGMAPPNPPTIEGPEKFYMKCANDECMFRFRATDPDDDALTYYIDWGIDYCSQLGNCTIWTHTDPAPSGQAVEVLHPWPDADPYTVRARSIDPENNVSEWTTFQTRACSYYQPAPSWLFASSGFPDRIAVHWEEVPCATEYDLYRSSVANDPCSPKVLLATVTYPAYGDTEPAPGNVYSYAVVSRLKCDCYPGNVDCQADCNDLTSPMSVSDDGSRTSGPAPPTDVKASKGMVEGQCHAIHVTWTWPPYTDYFTLYRNGTAYISLTTNSYWDTQYCDWGMYEYRIKAHNENGESGLSEPDWGFSGMFNLDPPAEFSASRGRYHDRVLMTWSAVEGAAYYSVYRSSSRDGEFTVIPGAEAVTALYYEDTAIERGVIYFYKIHAFTGCHTQVSRFSKWVLGYCGGPPSVANLRASSFDFCDRTRIEWDPLDERVWGDITYWIEQADSEDYPVAWGGPWETQDAFYDDSTAQPGKLYYYRVKAINECCGGPWVETSGIYGVPRKPEGLEASDSTRCDVALSWDAVPWAETYEIWRAYAAQGFEGAELIAEVSHPTTEYIDATAPYERRYWIVARNSCGRSVPSYAENGAPITPPDTVNVYPSQGTHANRINLQWPRKWNAQFYKVWRSTADDFNEAYLINPSFPQGSCSGSDCIYSDSDVVVPGTVYYYWIEACNPCSRGPGRSGSGYLCSDSDRDNVCDRVDNCPTFQNPDQADADADRIGDMCDSCTDTDGDGFGNPGFPASTCPIDNCPTVADPKQTDTDGDGIGDVCDPDDDSDGVADLYDVCPLNFDPNQEDADADGAGDLCDNCPLMFDRSQHDEDGDGIGDVCDNCRANWDPNQTDSDSDGVGDLCDNCPNDYDPRQVDTDLDRTGDVCDEDDDNDGILDDGDASGIVGDNSCQGGNALGCDDNCRITANPDQGDIDLDGAGDLCDKCPYISDPNQDDTDADGLGNLCDNCPGVFNPDQNDLDYDGLGDCCDPDQPDGDMDGVADQCDNCPDYPNTEQADSDYDGIGNACECHRVNFDGVNPVDIRDLLIMAVEWLRSEPDLISDTNRDRIVDYWDFAQLGQHWRQACPCIDLDADGYGNPASSKCEFAGLDCNDNDPNVNPAAIETCDGMDNNCDGTIDDIDRDGDGYTDIMCGGNDCNDTDPNINPAADEIYGNLIDDDCDGMADCADPDWACADADGDGYGNPTGPCCTYAILDCNDANPDVHPGADEVCGNGIDDDCDGRSDCADGDCAGQGPCPPACWYYPAQCHGDADGLLEGDCDGPQGCWRVGDNDLVIVQASWGRRFPDPRYNPCADFNHDGRIDPFDLNILTGHYKIKEPPLGPGVRTDCPQPTTWPPAP